MIPAKSPKPRSRRCKVCREQFVKQRMGQVVCSPKCAADLASQEREKRARAEYRVRKEAIKTRSDYIKEAQIAFNSFIRCRDAGKPCICFGLPLVDSAVGGGFDCGHYRSVGSAPHLRFDERNAHGQRKQCNRYGAGRAVDYRIGLIARIGIADVEVLEADQTSRKWSIDELKAIKKTYQLKLRELKARA